MHPSASFSATIRVRLDDTSGAFARFAAAVGEVGALRGAIDIVCVERGTKIRGVAVLASDATHLEEVESAVRSVEGVSRAIADVPNKVWTLTAKQQTVAVVTDGSAVLGLGDIGPAAALPVMEGKAMLFKDSAASTRSRSASTRATRTRSSRP